MGSQADYITAYKEQLARGDIQVAYRALLRFVMRLRAHCEKAFPTHYVCGNVSPGYMDFTYFPFFNDALRHKKLRFGIVLNHAEMRFELWLMGQNADVQAAYWAHLKTSVWNHGREKMPRYSVLEVVLVTHPDFEDAEALNAEISGKALRVAEEIIRYLEALPH
jgi:hypothetical protein